MVSCEEPKPGGLYSRRRNTSGASFETMDVEVATSGHASKAESAALLAMSMTHLVMLNAIVCGLEFCASAAFCYIPPMLLKAGIRCVALCQLNYLTSVLLDAATLFGFLDLI